MCCMTILMAGFPPPLPLVIDIEIHCFVFHFIDFTIISDLCEYKLCISKV